MKTYVSYSAPLKFHKFDEPPMGWVSLEITKKRMKEDNRFAVQFSKDEQREIMEREE